MKSSYAIAYSDKNGHNFCGDLPWILDDFSNEEDCILNAHRLLAEGFKNVIPFRFESRRRKMEEFDWEYVKNNKIAIE